jgi:hypothetical protein
MGHPADSLNELGAKKLSGLRGLMESQYGKEILKDNSERDLLEILTHAVLFGLFAYKNTVRLLRQSLESPEHLNNLRAAAKQELAPSQD